MSPVASNNFQAVIGNTARALSSASSPAPESAPQTGTKVRTPLSLVVGSPRKRRAPFVVFCFAMLVAALTVVLMLNVSVSSGQYKLVDLKSEQSTLLQSNQTLEQKVDAKEAPQNLVASAKALGMVPAATMGQINVNTKAITGNPQPAVGGGPNLTVLAPPAIDTPQEVDVPQPKPAAVPAPAGTAGTSATPDLNGGTIPAPAQKSS